MRHNQILEGKYCEEIILSKYKMHADFRQLY
jgi:hypothetical protein